MKQHISMMLDDDQIVCFIQQISMLRTTIRSVLLLFNQFVVSCVCFIFNESFILSYIFFFYIYNAFLSSFEAGERD